MQRRKKPKSEDLFLFKILINKDVIIEILSFLNHETLSSFETSSKTLFDITNSTEFLYEQIYRQYKLNSSIKSNFREKVKKICNNKIEYFSHINKELITSDEKTKSIFWENNKKLQYLEPFQEKDFVLQQSISLSQPTRGLYADTTDVVLLSGEYIYIYNMKKTLKEVFRIPLRTSWYFEMVVNKEKSLFYCGGVTNNVSVYDRNQNHDKIGQHLAPICTLELFPNEKRVISGSEDKSINIWDIEKKSCVTQYNVGLGVYSTSISKENENIFISGGEGGIFSIWDCRTDKSVKTLDFGINSDINGLDFHPSDNIFACAYEGGSTIIYDQRLIDKSLKTINSAGPRKVGFSKTATHLLIGENDKLVAYNILTDNKTTIIHENAFEFSIVGDGSVQHPFGILSSGEDVKLNYFGQQNKKDCSIQ
eukprot:gene11425-4592_t